jgi:hypothetical protein
VPTFVSTEAPPAPSDTPGPNQTLDGGSAGTASVTITPDIEATTTRTPIGSPQAPGSNGGGDGAGWRPGTVFWWVVGAGSIVAGGTAAATALLLRRRQLWGA